MKSKTIIEFISILLVVHFSFTAIEQLVNHNVLRLLLEKAPVMGPVAEQASWIFPFLQFTVVFLLLFRRTRLAGLFCSFIITGMVTIYIIATINTGETQTSKYIGLWKGLSLKNHIILNIIGILLSGLAIILSGGLRQPVLSHEPEVRSQDSGYPYIER